jgi:MerR family redox-sensitive transcriptional activator SoxR
MTEADTLTIGQLARRAGVTTSALRFYERIGLLPAAERERRRRRFPVGCVERVALIRLCQDAGFTLAEIAVLLADWHGGGSGWRTLAEQKVVDLEARITQAQHARTLVERALACDHADLLACPRFRRAVAARLGPD